MTALAILVLFAGVAGTAMAVGIGASGAREPSAHPHVEPLVPVTASNLITKPSNNSPTIAVDPTDDRFVVLANRRDAPFDCALHVSGDGGRGWLPTKPVPELPAGVDSCYGPDVAFTSDGTLYFLFVGLAGQGNEPVGVYLTSSTDRGRTFATPWEVLGPLNFGVGMAVDQTIGDHGRIHLVWVHATSDPSLGGFGPPPNPILAAHSDDGGKTFSEPVQVSDPERQRVVAPALAVGPDQAVHVVYYDLKDDATDYQGLEGATWPGTWSLVSATSGDGGETFAPGILVEDSVVPPERVMLIFTMAPPALAVDGSGQLYVSWHDALNQDWDVFVRTSSDDGQTWGARHRVNDDPVGNDKHQHLPQLAVAPDGRVDAIFYDRRDSPENRTNAVYYTYSTDGGASFAPNTRLTSLSSDSRIGPRYVHPAARGLIEFGNRLGLASSSSGAVAAWTDTTNTVRGPPSQDIMATEVVLPPDPGLPGWARWAGLALAMIVGVMVVMWYRRRQSADPQTAPTT